MLKISVVTACFEAAEYIEETLRSILNQGYPNLEFIVVDGGSTDGTCEIIERYRSHLAYYVSEPDGGQYEAIQKGFSHASGDILCWLNADDVSVPWALSVVEEVFTTHPDVDWITGLPGFLNRRGQLTAVYGSVAAYPRHFIANGWYNSRLGGYLQQESMFWRKSLWEKAGGLDLSLRYAADYDLWTRFARHAALIPISVQLAAFRKLPGEQRSSVGSDKYEAEVAQVMAKLSSPPALWRLLAQGGLIARSLVRQLIFSRQPAIIYDDLSGQWCKVATFRSIARLGLRELSMQFAVRGQKCER